MQTVIILWLETIREGINEKSYCRLLSAMKSISQLLPFYHLSK